MYKEQYVEMFAQIASNLYDVMNTNEVGIEVVYLDNYNGGEEDEKMHYKHDDDSGFDLRAAIAEPMSIAPNQRVIIPTGVKIACPQGTEIQVRPRSGTALKKGLTVVNSPGTVDAGYRGEIGILAINVSDEVVVVGRGERVAQAVLCPVYKAVFNEVDELSETVRGDGAYNSTGRN